MRIIMNGTTITGSVSEVLATLTHLGFKASDTTTEVIANDTAKSVTMGQVAGITVTDANDVNKIARSIIAKLREGERVLTPVTTATPVPVPKPARDSVIKQAISDVEDLLSRDYYSVGVGKTVRAHVGASVDFVIGAGSDRVDFFINADKKTVIAKLFINSPGFSKTVTRQSYATQGRAKCAPGDVFNEHIGKAIALRRALGLEVPVEYFEVEARDRDDLAVGDVVLDNEVGCDDVYEISELIYNPYFERYPGQAFRVNGQMGWIASSQVTLINDSARHTAPDLEVSRIIRH